MSLPESLPPTEIIQPDTVSWFKNSSLNLLRDQLRAIHYPGYPLRRLTYADGAQLLEDHALAYLPNGPWQIEPHSNAVSDGDAITQANMNEYLLDQQNRPVHPWIADLLAEDIGIVTGKGFYWHWGANRTADPVIIRTDTPKPMTLLIQRSDTKQWALAGGFVEPDEPSAAAALREAYEETLIDWTDFDPKITPVYSGPLADIRCTANAWPETDAFALLLDPNKSAGLSLGPMRGNAEEVEQAAWFDIDQAGSNLFGSHRLLIELACRQLKSV